MSIPVRLWHGLTLTGYLGTMALLVAWYGWLAPSSHFPVVFVLLVLVLPLFLPLRGLLHGRPYTHAWSLFLVLFYFVHGVVEAWTSPEARVYALLEVFLTSLWFVAAICYVRGVKRAGLTHSSEQ